MIEDSDNSIGFWRKKLDAYEAWNSLPVETRKRLIKDLKLAVLALSNANLTEKVLLDWIQKTSVSTVFDAVIITASHPDLDNMNGHEITAYLRRVVFNSERGKLQDKPVIHKEEVVKKRKRKGKPITLEYLDSINPYNFGVYYCKYCRKRIRKDNQTGVCSSCQKRGRNGEQIEH